MLLNRWIIALISMALISQFSLATEEDAPLLTPYRPGVPLMFFGPDENLLPEDMESLRETVGAVIKVLGEEAVTYYGCFTLKGWEKSLVVPEYHDGEAPYAPPADDGTITIGSLHHITGTPIHYQEKPMAEMPGDSEESVFVTKGSKEKIDGAFFHVLESKYNFLNFMPLISDKKPLSYGSDPYKTYVHQEWLGITNDPTLVLTSHRAGPCILFGVRNKETGKRAIFHTISHLYHFPLALYLIQELADGHLENLDIKMACAVLTPTSLAFASGLNKIMTAHGVRNLIPLHIYPVVEVGTNKYYLDESIHANVGAREDNIFAIGMTVSKDEINVFDSEDANDIFPSFGFHPPFIGSRSILLGLKPPSASEKDWERHVKIFTDEGGSIDRIEIATHSPTLIVRKI